MRGRKEALNDKEKYALREFREAGVPVGLCAKYFEVSRSTAARALAELRKKFGPEKIAPNLRHSVRFNSDTSRRATYRSE